MPQLNSPYLTALQDLDQIYEIFQGALVRRAELTPGPVKLQFAQRSQQRCQFPSASHLARRMMDILCATPFSNKHHQYHRWLTISVDSASKIGTQHYYYHLKSSSLHRPSPNLIIPRRTQNPNSPSTHPLHPPRSIEILPALINTMRKDPHRIPLRHNFKTLPHCRRRLTTIISILDQDV